MHRKDPLHRAARGHKQQQVDSRRTCGAGIRLIDGMELKAWIAEKLDEEELAKSYDRAIRSRIIDEARKRAMWHPHLDSDPFESPRHYASRLDPLTANAGCGKLGPPSSWPVRCRIGPHKSNSAR